MKPTGLSSLVFAALGAIATVRLSNFIGQLSLTSFVSFGPLPEVERPRAPPPRPETNPGLYEWSRELAASEMNATLEKLLFPGRKPRSPMQCVSCTQGACFLRGPVAGEAELGRLRFLDLAKRDTQVTDKVRDHSYQTMYGAFLLPQLEQPSFKFLEIGLGCGMNYGAGASVSLWRRLFRPDAQIWMAEFNKNCVEMNRKQGKLPDFIRVVTGNQGDRTTVERWVQEIGGDLDVVVDDGGHFNDQILTSFEALWPAVKPGGLYFVEDLQVGRETKLAGRIVIADLMKTWAEQLAAERRGGAWPLPEDMSAIFCQREACVFRKTPQPSP